MAKKQKQGNIQRPKPPSERLFDPGAVTLSNSAMVLDTAQPGLIVGLLAAHCKGDWPNEDPNDAKLNRENIEARRGDVMSVQKAGEQTIWIKTDLNRLTTWIGTPDEYH